MLRREPLIQNTIFVDILKHLRLAFEEILSNKENFTSKAVSICAQEKLEQKQTQQQEKLCQNR